ncbi:MAG: outer membrane beta-barrel protein [Bacteroidetes bacterium]|nr:outer membrane beta-barrel protein [Bacteroidota bacterium]
MKKINLITRSLLAIFVVLFFTSTSIAQDEGAEKSDVHKEHKEFKMNNVDVEHHGKDTTVIIIHRNGHDHEMGHCPFWCRKNKFNGHWAGIDLGWNGYVNSNFNTDFPANERYMDLNTARSMTVDINPFELNLNLAKNHFGVTSGLGLTWNNYYFSNSTLLIHDSSKLVAYRMIDQNGTKADMRTNKLTVMWLTLPVLFEYQTNSKMRWNSFHVTLGAIGGVRICSYTKQSFYPRNTTFYLQDDNAAIVGSVYADEHPTRTHNQYHLNPFKLDATFRIGWSFLNFYANYTITPMFEKNQGPELYPWAVGITLIGW